MTATRPRLDISVQTDREALVLRLRGDLDADSAGSLVARAEAVVGDGARQLVIDCELLEFCDSFGLRALLTLADRVEPHGTVTIAHPSVTLRRMLEITNLTNRFIIEMPDLRHVGVAGMPGHTTGRSAAWR